MCIGPVRPYFIMDHNSLFNYELRRLYKKLCRGFGKNVSTNLGGESQERRGWKCCRCLQVHMADRRGYGVCLDCRTETVQVNGRPCHNCKDLIICKSGELEYTRWQKKQAEVGWVHENPRCYKYNGDINLRKCQHCGIDRAHDYSAVVAVWPESL
jgi:hypothetical protein